MSELFPGFTTRHIATSGAEIHCEFGGSGPPLLLLHGYPQTHAIWHRIAPRLAERFNARASREIEGIRDFIILHYRLNERGDPFWRDHREARLPDSLSERIALFEEAAHALQDSHDLFRVDSWVQVMLGQRLTPLGYHPAAKLVPEAQLRDSLASLSSNIARAVDVMRTHEASLRGFAAVESGP